MNTFPLWLYTKGWDQFPGFVHGFSVRMVNRDAALAALHATDLSLYTLKQVHGDEIVVVDRANVWEEKPEADGMITSRPGTLLGIATADCVPVLMVAPERGIAAALHAGWRGTLKGISLRAAELLASQWGVQPQSLNVALGPAIG